MTARWALRLIPLLVAACEPLESLPQKPGATLASGSAMPAAVEAVVAARCRFCHMPPAPHGIDLSTTTSLRSDQIPDLVRGLQWGLLPLTESLPAMDRTTLTSWCADLGFPVPVQLAPSVLRWSSDVALAGTDPLSHATAFVLEDGFIDHQAWTVVTAPDGGPGLQVVQNHSPGGNPSSYCAFPVPFHELAGDQSVDFKMLCGRWSGIALRVRSLHPPSRSTRVYVRIEIDRDAVAIVLVPTVLETRPPRVTEPFAGTYYQDGFYLTNSQPVSCTFAVRDSAGVAVYTARVVRANGAALADLRATTPRDAGACGSFVFWKYGLGGPTTFWDVSWNGEVRGTPRPPRFVPEVAP